MRRTTVAVLAALMTVSLVGAAGCGERRSGAAGIGATRSSSPPPDDPPGGSCATVRVEVNDVTDLVWMPRNDFPQATDSDLRKPSSRHCHFEALATDTYPAALMAVTFYRIDRPFDTPERVRDKAAEHAKCTDELAAPPAGVTLAVQCLETGPKVFTALTVLSAPRGYVHVWVGTIGVTGTPAQHTRAREISRQAAVVALDLI